MLHSMPDIPGYHNVAWLEQINSHFGIIYKSNTLRILLWKLTEQIILHELNKCKANPNN